jgi:hypothetical protein
MQLPGVFRKHLAGGSVAAAIGVLLFNLVDAFGTVRHLAYGAQELNPLMGALLRRGPLCFVVAKHLLASGGVLGIVAYGDVAIARIALRYVLLPLYAGIAAYQAALLVIVR